MGRVVELKDVLPAKVPVADVDEPTDRAIGQRGFAQDLAGTIVRVRLHRFDIDIDRQHVRVGNNVLRVAGRNVDVLPAETQHGGRARWRRVTEVETDRGLHVFAAPARL